MVWGGELLPVQEPAKAELAKTRCVLATASNSSCVGPNINQTQSVFYPSELPCVLVWLAMILFGHHYGTEWGMQDASTGRGGISHPLPKGCLRY